MYPQDISSLMLAQNDDIDEIYGEEEDFNDEENYWVDVFSDLTKYYLRSQIWLNICFNILLIKLFVYPLLTMMHNGLIY